jgi:hypothetical protein
MINTVFALLIPTVLALNLIWIIQLFVDYMTWEAPSNMLYRYITFSIVFTTVVCIGYVKTKDSHD